MRTRSQKAVRITFRVGTWTHQAGSDTPTPSRTADPVDSRAVTCPAPHWAVQAGTGVSQHSDAPAAAARPLRNRRDRSFPPDNCRAACDRTEPGQWWWRSPDHSPPRTPAICTRPANLYIAFTQWCRLCTSPAKNRTCKSYASCRILNNTQPCCRYPAVAYLKVFQVFLSNSKPLSFLISLAHWRFAFTFVYAIKDLLTYLTKYSRCKSVYRLKHLVLNQKHPARCTHATHTSSISDSVAVA